MAQVIIKFRDKEEDENGGNIGLTIEFDPEIDGDATGSQITPAQHLALKVLQSLNDEIED